MFLTRYTALIVVIALLFVVLFSPPTDFPKGARVSISSGASSGDVAHALQQKNVLRAPVVLQGVLVLTGLDDKLQAGDYVFERPLSVPRLAYALVRGDYGLERVRVRLPEGSTRKQMADILKNRFPEFDSKTFLVLTDEEEGFLFPDTYFFLPNVTTKEVVQQLEETFEKRIQPLRKHIKDSPYTEHEVITMASLIEREAHDSNDRRLIASVLWNRIELGMPLQVDAPLFFLFGRGSRELTREDLATTSPYNTYVHKGLPPGPIASPGLDAIDAALNPAESEYLYYLADEDGVTHFAEDFEGHQRNRERYLR